MRKNKISIPGRFFRMHMCMTGKVMKKRARASEPRKVYAITKT
jgi:hypothetical protein